MTGVGAVHKGLHIFIILALDFKKHAYCRQHLIIITLFFSLNTDKNF